MQSKDLYDENGYLNVRRIMKINTPFIFIVGGRATGKTYTSLKVMIEDGIMFMYMRRNQSQLDLINKPEFSPYKSINTDLGWDIHSVPLTKYNSGYYHSYINDNGKVVPHGAPLGYTCALSTVSNLRGFDAQNIDYLIYDEFIPEKHERPIKNEASAFLNAYETINRNRELKGKEPLKVLCLANANDLANPIFMELGLVRKADLMRNKGQEIYINPKKGVTLIILQSSPISAQKRMTALYRLTEGSDFETMSLQNKFYGDKALGVNPQPIHEYKALVTLGEITIYQHKSKQLLYATSFKTGSCPTYSMAERDRTYVKKKLRYIWDAYIFNMMYFDEYLTEVLLTKYFK